MYEIWSVGYEPFEDEENLNVKHSLCSVHINSYMH